MAEHTGDYEWSGEGEGAEIVLYAPDENTAEPALERALPAARLPGVESPVHAASSPEGFGWVAVSTTHAAPDLISLPNRALLLVADVPAANLGMPLDDLKNFVLRGLGETGPMPTLGAAALRRLCEEGAPAAAEDGLIEEEDLPLLGPAAGDADALGRRALAAGPREWDGGFGLDVATVADILDADGAETVGLEPGMLALVVRVGAGDLGRLALAAHRDRVLGRIRAGADFGAGVDLPAAPADTEETADLLAAMGAASNFADGRTAGALYALRRVLGDLAGSLDVRAAWRVGGIEVRDGFVHRRGLAAVGEGKVLVSGGAVVVGAGKMSRSVPPFGVPEDDGRWPWEEAGLSERWASLGPREGEN